MTRAEVIAAVLAEHTRNGPVEEPGGGLPHSHWRTKCDSESCDFYAEGGYWDLVRQHTAHVAAALDAALAAQEGERGGAEVAAEWASNYDFRPHSDRASAEGVRARFGGFIYTRERTSFPDSVTAWRRADHIEAQP